MNGRMPTINDTIGLGVGRAKRDFEAVFEPTLPEHKVTTTHDTEKCTVKWQECEGANRYRVDTYRIEDRGPKMNDLNYILVNTEWTENTEYTILGLKNATSYTSIVFAYKDDECIGRYPSVFCILASTVFGDMTACRNDSYKAKEVSLDNGFVLELESLPAEKSVLLNRNPDRGFRAEEDYFVPTVEEILALTPESYVEDARKRIEKNVHGEEATVSRVYFILNKYVDTPVLPDAVLQFMQYTFDAYKKLGVRMYLCHYYQHSCAGEPVAEDIVLSHLKQISPLWEKNKDILHSMNFTFHGSYGEWTCMRKPVDRQKFVNAFMENAPDEVRLIMRHPIYKRLFVNPEFWRYNRIGFADDACHGTMFSNVDLGQSYTQPGSEWWEMCKKESALTLNDGELFTTRWIRLSGSWPKAYEVMQILSERHETTFSIQHGYGDICQFGGDIDQTCFTSYKSVEVNEEILSDMGLHYTDGWFVSANGDKVKRNAFEYLRDHIGYKISADKLDAEINGNEVSLLLSLKNYGYGAAFNLVSGFAILDSESKVIYEVKAGDPETWFGSDPDCYENRELLCHKVNAVLPADLLTSGCQIAFYMKNSFGQFARLDNTVEFKDGYNILCKIK